MVVFVDVNSREIHVYSEDGIKKIPFHDAHILNTIVENKKITYVTNVLETTADEVVNLVRGLSGQQPITQNQRTITPDIEDIKEATYLHSTSKGTLLVSDIDMRFDGFADCKIFDDNMKENIKQSPMLRSLIKKGIIEIIGEQKKNDVLAENRVDLEKKAAQQSARDEALDDIIMNEKVGDWDGQIAGDSIAIEIDASRRSFGGGSEESHGAATMSELQSMIDGTM